MIQNGLKKSNHQQSSAIISNHIHCAHFKPIFFSIRSFTLIQTYFLNETKVHQETTAKMIEKPRVESQKVIKGQRVCPLQGNPRRRRKSQISCSEVVERSLGLYMRRKKLFAFTCQSFSSHFLNLFGFC